MLLVKAMHPFKLHKLVKHKFIIMQMLLEKIKQNIRQIAALQCFIITII